MITRATGINIPHPLSEVARPPNQLFNPHGPLPSFSTTPPQTLPSSSPSTLHLPHTYCRNIMTRTERSHSLRALLKDRSEARNGMNNSLPKGGAGAHNWGSLNSEFRHETDAIADEAAELEDVDETKGKFCRPPYGDRAFGHSPTHSSPPSPQTPRNQPLCAGRAASPMRTVKLPSRFARTL